MGVFSRKPLVHDESLLDCSVKDKVELCRAKLEAGSDPNSCNSVGQTALHVAAIWGSVGVGRLLIDAGAQVDVRNKLMGATPLMFAAQRSQTEFAKLLLRSGADLMAKDDDGRPAYMFATDNKLRELLGGPSAKLIDAVRQGNVTEVAKMLQSEPHLLLSTDGDGNTPMAVATEQKHWDIACLLAEQPGAEHFVNKRGSAGDAPLHQAVRARRTEVVTALLKNGANPNVKSSRRNEYTRGNYDRTDPNTGEKTAISSDHRTALFESLESDDVDMAKLLIENGCDVNITDGDGCTPLYVAIDEGDREAMCELLLGAGASPDIGNARP